MSVLRLDPATPGERTLVFLPGFMTAADSYRALLEPLTLQGISVVVPQLYRRGIGALTGRATVEQEAADAADLVRDLAPRGPVWLGGHSRGGQAAFRAANLLATDRAAAGILRGLVLVDPVDGSGRAPTARTATAAPALFSIPCLIVGAGLGGRCAPEPVNHRAFADAVPSARHVVVTRLGHGDVLDDRPRARARRLCGGADDPDPGRCAVTALVIAAVLGVEADIPDQAGLLDWWRR